MKSIAISKTKPTPASSSPEVAPAVVLFGLDEGGKAHAAWFSADDEPLARKAATTMGLHALQAAGEPILKLAAGLPKGRVFASGRGFVPFTKQATYAALAEAAGLPAGAKKPAPKPKPTKAAADEAGASSSAPTPEPVLPKDWGEIGVGSLVLASQEAGDGWYESIVVEQKDDDLFVLRWRDWPELPVFPRRRQHLGLLHPNYSEA